MNTERLLATLGVRTARQKAALHQHRERVRAGLPFSAFRAVASGYRIEPRRMAKILDLPLRTLARRKKEGRLRPDESDRLLRFGRIALLAERTLGTREKASRWLQKPNRALGNEPPLLVLDTDLGAHTVEAVLSRIVHGVHA